MSIKIKNSKILVSNFNQELFIKTILKYLIQFVNNFFNLSHTYTHNLFKVYNNIFIISSFLTKINKTPTK